MKVNMATVNRNVREWLALTPEEQKRREWLVKSRIRRSEDGTLTVGYRPKAGKART